MESNKNRGIDKSKPVKVYWNLHRNCYSVQQNGLVVGHTDHIELRDVTFKVNEAGRQRVLKERRKNVHAFIVGYLDDWEADRFWDVKIVYNPYKHDSFRLWTDERTTVKSSEAVALRTIDGKSRILSERKIGTHCVSYLA